MRLFFIAAVLSLILPPFAGFSRAFSQTLSSTPPISHASTPLVHNDFDGDGISDIVLYINQNDGSPNEYVYSFDYSSKKNSLLSNIEFGSSGDILAPGRYDGSKSDLAVVKKGVDALTWVIRSTEKDKIIEEVDFGKPGDIVVSGCDFDGDALTDLAVISDGVLKLRRSSNNNTVQIPMNLAKEAVIKDASCADIDADNKADF
ncbi:MAG: hypothetical protein KDD56_10930, partial [Bdellovibrionales bacterium]|nr:hypothetical protein [Bdellovibrionales bacterium]